MTPEEIAGYKEQMFGSNGQASTQSPTPAPTNTPPAEEKKAEETPAVPISTTQPAKPDTPKEEETIVDDTAYLKELGFESLEAAKAANEELKQLREAAKTPKEIQYANEQSKAVAEALAAGKFDEVYEILDTQRKVSEVDKMKAADAIKLHIQQTNKHYKQVDVEDVFEEKYAYPEKPIQSDIEDENDFKARVQKWEAAKEKIDRRIERDAATAKQELAKLKTELKFPETNKPTEAKDEGYVKYQAEQQALAELQKTEKEAYSKLSPKDIAMVFKFNDEASKLAFDIAYEPEKENFDKAIAQASDITKFFENYYGEDGSPKRNELARAIYVSQNIDKIVSEAMIAATNETKKWFLANQKNLGDRLQRNFTVQPPSEIDKLKAQVFGN